MFRCQLCGECSQPREKQNKVIIKSRPREYHYFIIVNKLSFKSKPYITENEDLAKREENKIIKEITSRGSEIVEEKIACNKCYTKENKKE